MLFYLLRKLLNTRFGKHIAIDAGVVLLIVSAIAVWKHTTHVPDIIVTSPETKVVYVDKPVVTTNEVFKVIKDPADQKLIAALLAENKALKTQVTQLNVTVTELIAKGGGTPTPDPTHKGDWNFADWRLQAVFAFDPPKFEYNLHQKFEILSTVGRNDKGQALNKVELFEVGPKGQRIPAQNTQTTTFAVDETRPHWFVSPAIQAGLALTPNAKGAIIGAQWLKRGRTKAAEDSTLSLLTPVAFISQGVKEAGVLPFSVNLGRIKHQPLKDLWVSPYVGFNPTNYTGLKPRFGFSLTATF